jgi:hypothetical protein
MIELIRVKVDTSALVKFGQNSSSRSEDKSVTDGTNHLWDASTCTSTTSVCAICRCVDSTNHLRDAGTSVWAICRCVAIPTI